MKSITSTFPSKSDAEAAVSALKEAGISAADVSLADVDERQSVVTALIEDGQVDAATAILSQSGVVDVDQSLSSREEGLAGPTAENGEVGPRSYRREDDPENSTLLPPLPK